MTHTTASPARALGAAALALAFTAIAPTALRCQSTPLQTELFGLFNQPVQVLAPPGAANRIVVVEKTGQVRLVKDGVAQPNAFLDIGGLVLANYEQGLLGMAFHPNFASNGFFYVDYTQAGSGATVILRYHVPASTPDLADPTSATVLLSIPQPYGNHNGGSLRFGPDGYLYIGMGDGGGGYDPNGNAQNTGSLLGKLLRLDVDHPAGGLPYGIPAGNPFAGAVPGGDEIACIGLRNPWQYSFDRLTGDLYLGDVGQDAREEIDFVPWADLAAPITPTTVKNFGWRCMEGPNCTGLSGCTCNGVALTMPVTWYQTVPSYAVIGGFVYRGCAIPDLRGTYFFADFGSGQIWSLQMVAGVATNLTSRTAELDPAGPDTITGVCAFGEDACGELYVVEHAGQIWKIVPASPVTTSGLVPYGVGTPGCSGAHTLTASCPPVLANPTWRMLSTNAPSSGVGVAALGEGQDVAGTDPGLGILLHVALSAPYLTWIAYADATGHGGATIAIPNQPLLIGNQLYGQIVWLWPASTCTPSASGLSATPALAVTFLP